MKTILVCNQKGGSGKTLIADEILYSFERSKIPVQFYDLDGQGGTMHDQQVDVPDAQVCVVDTAGQLQKEMADWMKQADVIVIPTRCTPRDIEPLARMMKAAKQNAVDAKIIYVMNGWNRFKAARDFVAWFCATNDDPPHVCIPQSEAFVQAALHEKSVVEQAPNSPAAEQTIQMANMVREAAGFEPESKIQKKEKRHGKE